MSLLALALGIALAAIGGERFVRGTVGIATVARIPPGIVGATVAAFATSSPELSVSVIAALGGDPAIALGDATGSSLVNLGVVLGLTVVLVPVTARWADIRRDLPAALAATGVLALLAADGEVTRLDAGLLLALFAAWITWAALDARRERSDVPETLGDVTAGDAARDSLIGLVALIAAGQLVVVGAKGLGDILGWDDFVVGAVLVAIGTSTPELVTALVAVRRGHADVGVGALLGSNVFNGLFIVGTAGAIAPIPVSWDAVSLALGFGLVATVLSVPDRRGALHRWRGGVLLAVYAAYLVALLVLR